MSTETKPEWLKRAGRGIEHGEKLTCVYEGEQYALVKMPGGTGWACLGQREYNPVAFFVLRKGESLLSGDRIHEGRMTKGKLEELVDEVRRRDAELRGPAPKRPIAKKVSAGINLKKAADDLKKLFGLWPYDEPSNYCAGDSYFAASMEKKYGKTIEELEKLTGVRRKR